MKNRVFFRTLLAVCAVCAAVTLAHLIYDIYAYNHCSIIEFIARELW